MSRGPSERERALQQLLMDHATDLERLVLHEAGAPLLRFEPVDDLVQGVRLHALSRAEQLETRSDEESRGWLLSLARRFLRDRRRHWFAVKRGGGKVLRYTLGGTNEPGENIPELADSTLGPSSRADQRDQLVSLTRAIALLLPRDQDVVKWVSEGASTRELAHRLEIELSAAEKLRARAFHRLRRAWRLVRRDQQGSL